MVSQCPCTTLEPAPGPAPWPCWRHTGRPAPGPSDPAIANPPALNSSSIFIRSQSSTKKQSPKKKWTPPPTPPHLNPQPPSLTSPTHRLRRLLRRLARVRRLLNRQRRGAGAGHGNALRQAVAVSGLGAAPGGGQNDQKINI